MHVSKHRQVQFFLDGAEDRGLLVAGFRGRLERLGVRSALARKHASRELGDFDRRDLEDRRGGFVLTDVRPNAGPDLSHGFGGRG